MTTAKKLFKEIDQKISLPAMEHEISTFWEQDQTFVKSVEQRDKDNSYVFYDGPPFATGLPHYGHILTSYIKDTVPRFFTMRGKRVERRFGWDCHGLPAECEVEKQLGISGKQDIEKYGVSEFNEKCKTAVLKCTSDWRHYVTRMGRWVDFDNDYKTMDMDYTESILWVFKSLYEKGLLYEGSKVVPYCYRCETPLSNFETRTDDAYRMRQDPSITVRFALEDEPDCYFLAWTTTPWTLPSNLALAVHPDIEYVKFSVANGEKYFIAKELLENFSKEFPDPQIIKTYTGKELAGMRYKPLFSYFSGVENAFQILLADYVTCEETGIVHQAPAFGEDDSFVCAAYNIEPVNPVDQKGCFTAEVPDFCGMNVHDANKPIIQKLKEEGKIVQHRTIDHSYPHCWRDDYPLIYRSISSWFVNVTKIKEMMLANNELINWIPGHIKHGSFGKWLEGARDWAITRNRYWGAPIPVWKCQSCDHLEVMGSIKEIEERSGKPVTDLHRPAIDQHEWSCPKCQGRVKRVTDVLDCWFESGSMPYAQLHYPFENKEFFEANFPADFIVEYIGQTRCWFYNMIVMSTALFNKPCFRNVICHGVVLGSDGRKMSKRLKNYPDPLEMFEKYGSDAVRYFLITSPVVKGGDIRVAESDIRETVREVLLPVLNVAGFFVSYANIDGYKPQGRTDSGHVLDRYILSEYSLLLQRVTDSMEAYELGDAAKEINRFIVTLSNWYIRRSRRRFWKEEQDDDKVSAYETLYFVLCGFSRIIAPFLPFLSEYLYSTLGNESSVHLTDWAEVDQSLIDDKLSTEMSVVRGIVSLGHGLRVKNRIKVRKPLLKIRVAGALDEEIVERYADIIAEELNVKSVEFVPDPALLGEVCIKLNASALGPRLGKGFKTLLAAAKDGNYEIKDNQLHICGHILAESDFELQYRSEGAYECASADGLIVALDLTRNEELIYEGLAREVIRHIQLFRKEDGLELSERIVAFLHSDDEDLNNAVLQFTDMICQETLCVDFIGARPDAPLTMAAFSEKTVEIEDLSFSIGIRRHEA
jgi:isoleucyl-tRNA synthetase